MAVVTALPDGRADGVMTAKEVAVTDAARMRLFDRTKETVKRAWGKSMGFIRSVGRWAKTRVRRIYNWITGKAVTPTAQWFARNAKRVGRWVSGAASGAWHWSASARAWVATPLRVAGSVTASMFTLMLIGSRILLIAVPVTAFLLVRGYYALGESEQKALVGASEDSVPVKKKTTTTRTVRKLPVRDTKPKATTTTTTKKTVTAPLQKKAAKKAPSKAVAKTALKKAPAKKAPANRPAAKKAPAKRASVKKAAPAPVVEEVTTTTETTVVEEKVTRIQDFVVSPTGWNESQELAVVNRIHRLRDTQDIHLANNNQPMASAYAGRVFLATMRKEGSTHTWEELFDMYKAEQERMDAQDGFVWPSVRKGMREEDRHIAGLLEFNSGEPVLV